MKTKSVFFAALLVTAAALSATGKNEPATTGMAVVSKKGSEVIKVIYRGENSGKVKIAIYNTGKEIVFSGTRNSTDGFILPLNFSGLQYGEYTIELTDGSGTKSEKIDYQPLPSSVYFHVSQINEEGKFLLSITGMDRSDINVKIYDAHNKLMHNSDRTVFSDFAELYSIKEYRGACTFEVSNSQGVTSIFNFHKMF